VRVPLALWALLVTSCVLRQSPPPDEPNRLPDPAPASVDSWTTNTGAARPLPVPPLGGGNCLFPHDADVHEINEAFVVLRIEVGPTGRAQSVNVMRDAGYGFGEAARECAMAMRFKPALDADGGAIPQRIFVRVRFTR
jgi:TonB family protein